VQGNISIGGALCSSPGYALLLVTGRNIFLKRKLGVIQVYLERYPCIKKDRKIFRRIGFEVLIRF